MDQPFIEKLPEKSPLSGPQDPENKRPRILIAPLDWGLGHATRCIPIIRELLNQGAAVWLAGEGTQEQLLKTEFPELPFLSLPGYRIRYAKTARGLIWKMIQQGPQLRRAIQFEHRWLKKIVKENQIDTVISDNRFGLYHPGIPCIFITHQLLIKSSAGKWTEKFLQKINYRYINRFTACWVPDMEGENNLAGELSHPPVKPTIPVSYIGLLSRLEQQEIIHQPGTEKKSSLLIILSGPEPQRSLLEDIIIRDISHYPGTAIIVRGLPGSASMIPSTNMIRFYNHLPAADLNTAMQEADFVISRSGYSTVMDVMVMQKKSILLPTPGQTEQEYLGRYLLEKGMALCVKQDVFSLDKALAAATDFNYRLPRTDKNNLLVKTINQFLHPIRTSR